MYFGARYYAPMLARWISPDPLAVHAGGADPNVYAYVSGSPHRFVDPVGLDANDCDNLSPGCSWNGVDLTTYINALGDAFSGGSGGGGGRSGGSGSYKPTPVTPQQNNRAHADPNTYVGWQFATSPGALFGSVRTVDTGNTVGNYLVGMLVSVRNVVAEVANLPTEFAAAGLSAIGAADGALRKEGVDLNALPMEGAIVALGVEGEELIIGGREFFADARTVEGLPYQLHHFATTKSSTFTQLFTEIAGKYGLGLDEVWNTELVQHLGRHPDEYHEFVLQGMREADQSAGGDLVRFLQEFETRVKDVVRANPGMLRKAFW